MKGAVTGGEVYGGLVFAAGVVLGTIRALAMEPAFGPLTSVALEIPVMLVIAWFVSAWAARRWQVPAAPRARLLMGAVALAVLILAEILFARLVFGEGFAEAAARFATPQGRLGLAAQIAAAAIPLLQSLARRGA